MSLEQSQLTSRSDAINPVGDAAANVWTQENSQLLLGQSNLKVASKTSNNTEQSFKGDDAKLEAFFNDNLSINCMPPVADQNDPRNIREFEHGEFNLERSTTSIQDALKSLDGNDSSGATQDINRALQSLDRGTDDIKDGVKATRGETEAKDDINDGLKEVGFGKEEMKNALEFLKKGNICEAKEALKLALSDVGGGISEISFGVQDIESKHPHRPDVPRPDCPVPQPSPEPSPPKPDCPPNPGPRPEPLPKPQPGPEPDCPTPHPVPTPEPCPPKPEPKPEPTPDCPQPKPEPCPEKHNVEAHMKEIGDSGRHFKNTGKGLNTVLLALARGDTKSATQGLGYCLSEVTEGIGDLRYGAGGDANGIPNGNVKAGEALTRSGLQADDTQRGIINALNSLQDGHSDKAIDSVIKAIQNIIRANKSVGQGWTELHDNDDNRRRGGRGN